MGQNSPFPSDFPETFSYREARAAGLGKRELYLLRDAGEIESISHGVYRRAGAQAADIDLLEIAKRNGRATLCLASALAHHGLTDAIPPRIDVALPRGTRPPACRAPVQWHFFDRKMFELGRELLAVDTETSIGIYGAERSIVDAFRTRGTSGSELAYESLKQWLRRRGSQPSALLHAAKDFPRALAPIRKALEVLL